MIHALVLGLLLVTTPPAPAPAVQPAETIEPLDRVADDDEAEEGCVFNNYFCYLPESDSLHPAVADAVLPIYFVGLCCPFGFLWGPLIFVPGASWTTDLVINYLAVFASTVLSAYIPYVGGFAYLAMLFYIGPVSMIRGWSRAMNQQEAESRLHPRKRPRRPHTDDEDEPKPRKRTKRPRPTDDDA